MTKFIDLTGNIYGNLTVLSRAPNNKWNKACWYCQCICGNIGSISTNQLKCGTIQSCGCRRKSSLKDRVGHIYSKLKVIKLERSDYSGSYWQCLCECGNTITVSSRCLRSGNTKSCGCIRNPDLTGQRFGKLILIQKTKVSPNWSESRMAYKCKCDCGREKTISLISLQRGAKSCGFCDRDKLKLAFGEAVFNSLVGKYKQSARKRNLDFKLSNDELRILFQDNCYYCGTAPYRKMKNSSGKGYFIYNGIDRVDNNKGYINNNVVTCCIQCNKAKLDMDLNDFLDLVKKIYKRHCL